ncbi:MAG: NAD kinase [Paludibacteraceae bacterium]|nr:NAD kinase [Paludibacteraceae bacterium]
MRIAIFGSVHKKGFAQACAEVLDVLRRHGSDVLLEQGVHWLLLDAGIVVPANVAVLDPEEDWTADLVLSLGGDGTFLQTAQAVGRRSLPILGINLGHLGFMVDVMGNEISTALDEVLTRGFQTEARSLLHLERESDGRRVVVGDALNEVAVLKLDTSSMVKVHTTVCGNFLCTYRADGLLVSTPTGSTGYALSVGASILAPENHSFILSPVAPHSLNQRPLVVPDHWDLQLDVDCRTDCFLVSIDGRSQVLERHNRLFITKAGYPVVLAKRKGHTYFETLRDKLMWGKDTRGN